MTGTQPKRTPETWGPLCEWSAECPPSSGQGVLEQVLLGGMYTKQMGTKICRHLGKGSRGCSGGQGYGFGTPRFTVKRYSPCSHYF